MYNYSPRSKVEIFVILSLLVIVFMLGFKVGDIAPKSASSYVEVTIPNPPKLMYSSTKEVGMAEIEFDKQKQLTCLTDNIYFEARGQVLEGQIAVGLVTLNRVMSKEWPDTICEVVWQKRRSPTSGKMVAQFSWTLDGRADVPHNFSAYYKASQVARRLMNVEDPVEDFTKGSDHYHAFYVKPIWRHKMQKIATIGDHLFYKAGPDDLTKGSIQRVSYNIN